MFAIATPQLSLFNLTTPPPTMTLADYLAQKYLTADTPSDKKSKKRKRKNKEDGLKIADDDLAGWSKGKDDDEDDPRLGTSLPLSSSTTLTL